MTMIPEIAFVTLMRGVWSAGVTFQITCQPTTTASRNTVRCCSTAGGAFHPTRARIAASPIIPSRAGQGDGSFFTGAWCAGAGAAFGGCGAAVLATIFNYAYGKKTTERQVLVNMLKIADPDIVREKGFSLLDMKNYALAVDMKADGYTVDFEALRQLKVPAITLLNIRGYKHFVVLRKVDGDYVHVGDPALGNRVMSRRKFEAAWNGVVFAILGEGYNEQNVLSNPPEPLSARRLYALNSPVFDAEVYDFGLGPATSFSF